LGIAKNIGKLYNYERNIYKKKYGIIGKSRPPYLGLAREFAKVPEET
jgi:hypothetical protein